MITLRLHYTRAVAILDALEGRQLGGKARASVRRGVERIEAALGFAQMHPLDERLDRLGDVMMDVRSRAVFEQLRALLDHVGRLAALWSAVEQLPPAVREGLLDPSALGDPEWVSRARAAVAAHRRAGDAGE